LQLRFIGHGDPANSTTQTCPSPTMRRRRQQDEKTTPPPATRFTTPQITHSATQLKLYSLLRTKVHNHLSRSRCLPLCFQWPAKSSELCSTANLQRVTLYATQQALPCRSRLATFRKISSCCVSSSTRATSLLSNTSRYSALPWSSTSTTAPKLCVMSQTTYFSYARVRRARSAR
jgi:hypothetical protein